MPIPESSKLFSIFKLLELDGYANAKITRKKSLQFDAFTQELTFSDQEEKSANLSVFSGGRKISFSFAGCNDHEIISQMLEKKPFFDLLSSDPDNTFPVVTNQLSVSASQFDIRQIGQKDLLKEWEKVRDFPLDPSVELENFWYEVNSQEHLFFNSAGAKKRSSATGAFYGVALFGNFGDAADAEYVSRSSDSFVSIPHDFPAQVQKDLLARKEVSSPQYLSGWKTTVSLDKKVVAAFLEILASGLKGENIRQKRSPFTLAHIDKKILGDNFTLKNRISLPGSPFFHPFDAEWVDSEDLILIQDGVLKNVFLNSKNATKLGLPPNGNPGVCNLELIGEKNEKYLEGSSFLFTELMGFHTVSSSTWKFALEWSGFEVYNGQWARFVRNISLVSSLDHLFSHVVAFWNDADMVDNILTPSITCSDQTIVV